MAGPALRSGDLVLIQYVGNVPLHGRLLLVEAGNSITWIILTPDEDMYAENVCPGNPDINGLAILRSGVVPRRLEGAYLDRFQG